MTRIHIRIADAGWILEKCAREISDRSPRVSYGLNDDSFADLQYYINYSGFKSRISPVEVAFFTHSEPIPAARERYFSVAKDVDHRVCMSERYAREMRDEGFDNVTLISPGVDLALFRPVIRIGVIGRTYHTGRKGESLVAEVMDVPGIDWQFTGAGWPKPSITVADADLPDFYNSLDYVLIPSLYEGGPMSMLEGLACGVPVIAPDVGWVGEFPHIPFERGNASSLRQVLRSLVNERTALRESVSGRTWEAWADAHLSLFDRLLSERPARAERPALPRPPEPTAAILSASGETVSRGGPTTRIANIVATAAERNETIEVKATLADEDTHSTVHVFNSWPLHYAPGQLALAERIGARSVYSPIALNLSYLPYFVGAIPAALRLTSATDTLRHGIEKIRALTAPYVPHANAPPAEGVKGHFSALKRGVELADHVIFLSSYEEGFVRSLGTDIRSSSIVRNGVDTAQMAAGDAAKFTSAYGLKDFVLVVGRIEPRKNQALIAHALKDIGRPVVLLGHVGEADYFTLLKKWAGPNLVQIDRIEDRAMLASAYKAAACLVLTSWAEGAPLSALEAGAAGTPLFLSNMSGESEYFGDLAKYFHPCDLDGLTDAVRRELAEPETPAQRERRSQFICEHYDIARHVDDTLAVYRGLIESGADRQDSRLPEPRLYLENTHLYHQRAHGRPLTGVTGLELNVSDALVHMKPDCRSLIWVDRNTGYIEENFDYVESGGRCAPSVPLSGDGESRSYVKLLEVQVSLRSTGEPTPAAIATQAALPRRRRRRVVPRRLRLAWRAFLHGETLIPKQEPPPAESVIQPHAPEELSVTPRYARFDLDHLPDLNAGDRVFILGQPWISNEVMLADLCNLVQSHQVKLRVHVPDIVYVTDSASFDANTRDAYRRRLLTLLSVADSVITISRQSQAELRRFASDSGLKLPVTCMPLGVRSDLARAVPIKPDRVLPENFVIFVSSINHRKRHDFIVDVWKEFIRSSSDPRVRDLHLILVGSAQHGFEHYDSPSMASTLARHNIMQLRDTSSEQLSWLYQNCRFTLYPPRCEGWGLPPIESLHFGKVCVVSDTVPAAQETDCAGLIKIAPNDYYAWVDALKTLAINDGLRAVLEKKAKEYAAPTWDDAALALLDA